MHSYTKDAIAITDTSDIGVSADRTESGERVICISFRGDEWFALTEECASNLLEALNCVGIVNAWYSKRWHSKQGIKMTEVNGYMIKQAIRQLEMKRDAIQFDFTYMPRIVKIDENIGISRESEKQAAEDKFAENLSLLHKFNLDIFALQELLREYNEHTGIYRLIDRLGQINRIVTLLSQNQNAGHIQAQRRNDAIASELQFNKQPMYQISQEFITLHVNELEKAKRIQLNLKNKIGIQNTKMYRIPMNSPMLRILEDADLSEEPDPLF